MVGSCNTVSFPFAFHSFFHLFPPSSFHSTIYSFLPSLSCSLISSVVQLSNHILILSLLVHAPSITFPASSLSSYSLLVFSFNLLHACPTLVIHPNSLSIPPCPRIFQYLHSFLFSPFFTPFLLNRPLLRCCCSLLLASYTRHRYEVVLEEGGQWGGPQADGSVTGMIGMVARGEAHLAINEITITGKEGSLCIAFLSSK